MNYKYTSKKDYTSKNFSKKSISKTLETKTKNNIRNKNIKTHFIILIEFILSIIYKILKYIFINKNIYKSYIKCSIKRRKNMFIIYFPFSTLLKVILINNFHLYVIWNYSSF